MGFTSFMAVYWSIVVAFVLSMVREESRLVTIEAFAVGCAAALAAWLFGVSGWPQGLGIQELFNDRISVATSGASRRLSRSRGPEPCGMRSGRPVPAGTAPA